MIVTALAAGMAAGLIAWLAGGGPGAASARLAVLEDRVATLHVRHAVALEPAAVDVADLAASPIFQLTTGPGAVPAPVLRLDGLVRSRGRTAALLAVDDKPSAWLGLGEGRDGVTLQAVQGSKVVVDTIYGPVEVALGERPTLETATSPVMPGPGPVPTIAQTRGDLVPPSFRAPPPPASAPRRP